MAGMQQAGEGSDEVRAGQDRGLQIQDRRVAGMYVRYGGVEAAFTITSASVNDHDAPRRTQARCVCYNTTFICMHCPFICMSRTMYLKCQTKKKVSTRDFPQLQGLKNAKDNSNMGFFHGVR